LPVANADESLRFAGDADERDVLNVSPVGIAGLEAEGLELLDQVFHGLRLAHRSGRAAFEFIGGQHLHVVQEPGALVWGGPPGAAQIRTCGSSATSRTSKPAAGWHAMAFLLMDDLVLRTTKACGRRRIIFKLKRDGNRT